LSGTFGEVWKNLAYSDAIDRMRDDFARLGDKFPQDDPVAFKAICDKRLSRYFNRARDRGDQDLNLGHAFQASYRDVARNIAEAKTNLGSLISALGGGVPLVLVIGAGVSLDFIPYDSLYVMLHPYLPRKLVDRRDLKDRFERQDPVIFEELRRRIDKRLAFQRDFAAFVNDKLGSEPPTPTHSNIARLIDSGNPLVQVVSLNWDNGPERATKVYPQIAIGDDRIGNAAVYKPNGCVSDPGRPWVLPGETVRLSVDLRTKLRELPRPVVVVCVGVRGGSTITKGQIRRATNNSMAFDIRPYGYNQVSLGTFRIELSAEYALNEIAAGVV